MVCPRCSPLPRCSGRPRCSGVCIAGVTDCGEPRSSGVTRRSPALPAGATRGGSAVGGATCDGATTLTTGAGTTAIGFNSLRAAALSGLPGSTVNCCRCAAKPSCAGGGAVRATTGRSNMTAGGWLACVAAPSTLCAVGATRGTAATGALTSISLETCTAALETGCDCTNAAVGTAITAPGTCRLA